MTWMRRDVAWETSADGTAVHVARPDDGEVLVLDGVAAQLWHLADGRTTDDVVAEVVRDFGLDHEEAAAGVSTFLAQLEELRLMRQG